VGLFEIPKVLDVLSFTRFTEFVAAQDFQTRIIRYVAATAVGMAYKSVKPDRTTTQNMKKNTLVTWLYTMTLS